jgi:hypothetical protein
VVQVEESAARAATTKVAWKESAFRVITRVKIDIEVLYNHPRVPPDYHHVDLEL